MTNKLYSLVKERLQFDASVEIHECLASTNITASDRAKAGCEPFYTVAALSQTAGVGRMGRSFFSPEGTGLYMSTVLYPEAHNADLITGMAAVSLCEALESMGLAPEIKWVNDIFIDGKKVCGILARGIYREGRAPTVVLGIGINVFYPRGGFPDDIKESAGALFDMEYDIQLYADVFSNVLNCLYKRFLSLGKDDAPSEYKRRCLTVGKRVSVIPSGESEPCAHGYGADVDERYRIIVDLDSGERITLDSGEVSVRL